MFHSCQGRLVGLRVWSVRVRGQDFRFWSWFRAKGRLSGYRSLHDWYLSVSRYSEFKPLIMDLGLRAWIWDWQFGSVGSCFGFWSATVNRRVRMLFQGLGSGVGVCGTESLCATTVVTTATTATTTTKNLPGRWRVEVNRNGTDLHDMYVGENAEP